MTDRYDSECGKDAWKKWRRIVESIESPIQDMLHEFGAEMYEQGQRDMLAKCIAAVRAVGGGYSVPLGMSVSAFIDAMRHQFIAALHDLEETL